MSWSAGFAFAALFLLAPATASAADPDEGSGLLGGLTGGVTQVVEPVTQVVEPVLDPVIEDVVDPIAGDVVEPVTQVVEPGLEPVVQVLEPVTLVVDPVLEPVVQVLDPVVLVVNPVLEPVTQVVDPVLEPVTQLVDPVLEPVAGLLPDSSAAVNEPAATTPETANSAPSNSVQQPAPTIGTPPVASDPLMPTIPSFPGFTPEPATLPSVDPAAAAAARSITSSRGPSEPVIADRGLAGETPRVFGQRPQSADGETSGPVELSAPWWTRMVPIGAFGANGSGQALAGASIAMAMGLALLLLFLLPPPFRVSRLQYAAVFWRPQHFVGPLERPG